MSDDRWVVCHHCTGGEVWVVDTFSHSRAWVPCSDCNGDGGWWA